MKLFLLLFLLCWSISSQAQKEDYNHNNHSLHWVELTDKDKTPYSVFRPQEYLSARALERRQNMGIAIDAYDLPVTPAYINAIVALGAPLHNTSKWLNSIAVHTADEEVLKKIAALPFVKAVRPLGKFRTVGEPKLKTTSPKVDPKKHQIDYYGDAANQIKMLGGDLLHQYGYSGREVHVAIFDGGFLSVPNMPVFDSLYADNRLLGTHDFVEGDEQVYESSTHGTNVLGTMAANAPYLMVGTAPHASYYLFKTEDVRGEFRTEEFNWVAALEYADSLGVDVVNSSLGYTGFNDTTMSYTHAQLDGKTALSSRGANIGASRGILVVNSAGNEGDGPWHYIGTPADAPGVFTVGAVRPNGEHASFSSWGPTADGRIKPDVVAQGRFTVVPSINKYDVSRTNGTSFSSPVMAGMVASLRAAFPTEKSENLKEAIRQSSSQVAAPDSSLGFGIPNFFFAYTMLLDASIIITRTNDLYYTPKLIDKQLHIFIERSTTDPVSVTIYNHLMQQQALIETTTANSTIKEIRIPDLESYSKGVYLMKIEVNHQPHWLEIVKR